MTAPGQVEGWLTPLEAPGGVKLVVVPITASTLYVIEVRQPIGEDKGLCDKGLLVYTVDASLLNGRGPIRIKPAQVTSPERVAQCGLNYSAAYDVGPGEVSRYEDSLVAVEVLETDGFNYKVRVTRK